MAERGPSLQTRLLGRFLRFHQFLYERTDGRVGHHMSGRTFLLLRTVGRTTGRERVSALLYIRDDGNYVVVASNGGRPAHPGWYHNLRANPEAEIQVGRVRTAVRARDAGDDERERLWRAADDVNRGTYAAYQTRTERRIPVVVLEPAHDRGGAGLWGEGEGSLRGAVKDVVKDEIKDQVEDRITDQVERAIHGEESPAEPAAAAATRPSWWWIAAGAAALVVLLILVVTLGGGDDSEPEPATGNQAPVASSFTAVFNPVTYSTTYSVVAVDPEDEGITFAWDLAAEDCGTFTTDGATATWTHPHESEAGQPDVQALGIPADRLCTETADTGSHGGTITVVIGDGVNDCRVVYEGGSVPTAVEDPDCVEP